MNAPESSTNPYRSPETTSEPQNEAVRTPGGLAIIFIVVISIVAAGCTIICTCFGIAVVGINATNDLVFASVGIVAGVLAALAVLILCPRFLYRKMSRRKPLKSPADQDTQ